MRLAAWLLAMAGPLVKKALVALGIGVLTYAGLGAMQSQAQGMIIGALGQTYGPVLQWASMAGFIDGIGIVLGGVAARVALMMLDRIGKVVS